MIKVSIKIVVMIAVIIALSFTGVHCQGNGTRPDNSSESLSSEKKNDNILNGQNRSIPNAYREKKLSSTEMELIKYYVDLDYSMENPGFQVAPSERKRLKGEPVGEKDKLYDIKFFKNVEKNIKLWTRLNLLKTADKFKKDPQFIKEIVGYAMQSGVFARMFNPGKEKEIIKQLNQKYPEGIDQEKLRQKLQKQVKQLENRLGKPLN